MESMECLNKDVLKKEKETITLSVHHGGSRTVLIATGSNLPA